MDERNKLIRQIYEFDKIAEKNKLKRSIYTILFYIIVNTCVFYGVLKGLTGEIDINKFIGVLILSIIASIVSFIANTLIFSQLTEKGRAESEMLKAMEKRLEEFDKENNIEKKYPVEDFLKNRHM